MQLGKFAEYILPRPLFRSIARLYMRARLSGTTYYCPFCKGGFSEFYPAGFDYPVLKEQDVVGGGRREHVRCPQCSSSNRDRMMYLYLTDAGVAEKELSILHVAPEKKMEQYLKSLPKVKHVSVDIDPERGDMQMDIQSLRFPDATFDVVICNHVLEHVADDARAMREILRVLKPGGFAILQVPIARRLSRTYEDATITDPKDRERAYGQHDHVRLYARDYKDRLTAAGFIVDVVPYAEMIGTEKTKRYALDPREDLYVCRRPVG